MKWTSLYVYVNEVTSHTRSYYYRMYENVKSFVKKDLLGNWGFTKLSMFRAKPKFELKRKIDKIITVSNYNCYDIKSTQFMRVLRIFKKKMY